MGTKGHFRQPPWTGIHSQGAGSRLHMRQAQKEVPRSPPPRSSADRPILPFAQTVTIGSSLRHPQLAERSAFVTEAKLSPILTAPIPGPIRIQAERAGMEFRRMCLLIQSQRDLTRGTIPGVDSTEGSFPKGDRRPHCPPALSDNQLVVLFPFPDKTTDPEVRF